MSGTENDEAFLALTRKISRKAGLSLDAYKDKCLRRRIAVRMRASGAHSYADYAAVLDRDPEEYARLKDTITINVTRFYRNGETWELIRKTVLPQICGETRGPIRAWSAGCASGEEPYTLAMLMAEYFESRGRAEQLERVTVDATDIDRECLQRARVARYRPESLAEVPAGLLTRYFEQISGEYQVIERIRRQVVVCPADLCAEPPPGGRYDLILCRNVIIYFERPMQERIFATFADALAPGGFLILGKVESLSGRAREQLTLLDPRERIYRRAA
jgi:chemotaxis methyl-accepting protein methylase